MKPFVLAAVLALNMAGLLMMALDKHNARHGSRRIAERTLFICAILGGAPGVWLGMRTFRHKTRHAKFQIGIPFLLIINAFFYYALWRVCIR